MTRSPPIVEYHDGTPPARPPCLPIHGRRLEVGWELPLGDPPTTHYLVHVIRSAEQFRRVQELYK